MIYLIDFFKDYGFVLGLSVAGWAASRLWLNRAQLQREERLKATVERAARKARGELADPEDLELAELVVLLSEVQDAVRLSGQVSWKVGKYGAYALVHTHRRRIERQLDILRNREKELRATS